MTKKSFITLLMLLTLIAGNALAQKRSRLKGKNAEQRAEIKTKRMVTVLQLTADQQPKIKEIHLTAENALATVRADKKAGKITKEEAKAKSKEINKTRKQGIKSNLTAEQKKKYRQWRKKKKSHRGKGKDGDDTDTDDDGK
ncbi:MAG TPA: hypothetical protein DCS93_21340 [Microscillaceae bacterium]|nr:hypothetical protein [Microscillaceae bacterium]